MTCLVAVNELTLQGVKLHLLKKKEKEEDEEGEASVLYGLFDLP